MDLEPTDDQAALRDAVAEWLDRNCPSELVRRVVGGTEDHDVLWPAMVELGWPALTIPDTHGGLGLGVVEMTLVAEELGRRLVPGPMFSSAAIAVPFLRPFRGIATDQSLFGIAAGEVQAAVAIAEVADGWAPDRIELTIKIDGDGVVLNGTKRWVLDGADADQVLVLGRGADRPLLSLVMADQVTATPVRGLDPTRRLADLTFDQVHVPFPPGDHEALDQIVRGAIEEVTVALAADTVGACQAAFDLTVEYVKVREQFDMPIGSFQAVKHQLADAYVQIEKARALAHLAAVMITEDDPRRTTTVAMAKAAAGDCQAIMAEKTIQLHGGIGYTWEHDAHLYVKRMKANDLLFGTARHHRRTISDALLSAR